MLAPSPRSLCLEGENNLSCSRKQRGIGSGLRFGAVKTGRTPREPASRAGARPRAGDPAARGGGHPACRPGSRSRGSPSRSRAGRGSAPRGSRRTGPKGRASRNGRPPERAPRRPGTHRGRSRARPAADSPPAGSAPRISAAARCPSSSRPEAVQGRGTGTPTSAVMRNRPRPLRLSSTTYLLPRSAQSCAVASASRGEPVEQLAGPPLQRVRLRIGGAVELHGAAEEDGAVLVHHLEDVGATRRFTRL